MRHYIRFLGSIFLVFSLCAVLLDVVYTLIHISGTSRSKVQVVRSIERESYDYVLMGSSRVMYHVNDRLIDSVKNVNGINLGYPSAEFDEMLLLLKTFLKNGSTTQKLFLQVDNNWNSASPSAISHVAFLPYMKNCIISIT